MNRKGFSLIEVLIALLFVSLAMAIFRNIYYNYQNNMKMLSYQLLASHISNIAEDFSALENSPNLPLEYHGVDVNSLWKKVKRGSVENVRILDNGYEFTISFFGKEVEGVYKVYAEGREGRLSAEYETNFAVKKFK